MTASMSCVFRAAVMLVFWAAGAAAQTALVRSGEHPTFTRMAIDLPAAGTATLEQSGREVTVTLARPVTGFDLSGAFRRIARNRIADARATGDGQSLMLTLACDCAARLLVAGPRMIAIDVFDPAAQTMAPAETAADPSLALPLIPIKPAPARVELALPPPGNLDAVRQAEQRVLEQLARAAAQGLVTPQTDLSPGTARSAPVAAPAEGLNPVSAGVQVRVQTAQDAALGRDSDPRPLTLRGRECPDARAFDLSEWGGADFATGLGDWRQRQFGEFDRPDKGSAIGLARHYVHYGFGAEARQALRLADVQDAVLSDMAGIVDGSYDRVSGALIGLESCDSAVALWSLLSAPAVARPEVDSAAVGRAFLALPAVLQIRLGPDLAQSLNISGAAEAAMMVLRRLGQAGQGDDPAVRLGENTLQPDTDLTQGGAALAPVVAANTELSPSALSQMIVREVAAGRPITPETAELAAAFAFEQRSGADAAELTYTEILARAAADEFSLALRRAATAPVALTTPQLAQIFDLLVARAPDHVFVAQSMIHASLGERLPVRSANTVAERLVSLGFADQAEPYLTGASDGPEDRNRRILRARVALSQAMPRRAEAELLGLDGADADALRAQARGLAGDYSDAAQIYQTLQSPEDLRRADFLSGNWASLANSGDRALGDLARLKTAPDPPDVAGMLARNRALLEESSAVRGAIDRMLEEFGAAPDG